MSRKLNQADYWLISELENELKDRYELTDERLKECMENTNFMKMLIEKPIFTHHEGIEGWIKVIETHNQLIK